MSDTGIQRYLTPQKQTKSFVIKNITSANSKHKKQEQLDINRAEINFATLCDGWDHSKQYDLFIKLIGKNRKSLLSQFKKQELANGKVTYQFTKDLLN